MKRTILKTRLQKLEEKTKYLPLRTGLTDDEQITLFGKPLREFSDEELRKMVLATT